MLSMAAQAQIPGITGKSTTHGLAPNGLGLASGPAPIGLVAVLPPTLSLSISTVNLNLDVTDPANPSPVISVPITSFWNLDSSSRNVELVGYFDSPQQALADDANHTVPTSRVLGGLSGEPMMPFTESSRIGTVGASRTFYRQAISRENSRASRSDRIDIQLDRIADLGAPPGIYRGVLHLRIVAY